MSTDRAEDTAPRLHQFYAEQFRVDAVELIWLGYQRMNAVSFATSEEDDITGVLVQQMKLVIQDPESPEWVDRYHVQEQVLQNIDAKLGKRRPKMDIEFERIGRGPRPRLGFEAKRLGRGNAVGNYLGTEGLGAFLSGYYPTTHGEVGMLGYIQDQTPAVWSDKLASAVRGDPTEYQVADGANWHAISTRSAATASCTVHIDANDTQLIVIHVLLAFTSPNLTADV